MRQKVVLPVLAVLMVAGMLPRASADGVGWRSDGTGCYPKAEPPLEWSPTTNVVWKTPLPGYGVSHPVLLGERVFTCSEPATLLCLNRGDGKILWQKSSSYAELSLDPELLERLQGEQAEVAELKARWERMGRPGVFAIEANLHDRPPAPTLPRSPGHHAEWIRACKGGPAAMSNFDYAGPLTKMALLGNVAIRAGERVTWNSAELRATPDSAKRFIRREYRKGWTL